MYVLIYDFLIFIGKVNEFKKFNNLLSKCFLYLYKGIISESKNKQDILNHFHYRSYYKKFISQILLNKLKYFTSLSKAEDSFHVLREYP